MRNIGGLLLSIWLILHGLISLAGLSFRYDGEVMGILALVAGILMLINK